MYINLIKVFTDKNPTQQIQMTTVCCNWIGENMLHILSEAIWKWFCKIQRDQEARGKPVRKMFKLPDIIPSPNGITISPKPLHGLLILQISPY